MISPTRQRLLSRAGLPAALLPQPRFISSLKDYPTGEQSIADELEFFNEKKWGWVIYRCTYGDDAAWERFKELVARQTREHLTPSPYSDAPPVPSPRSVVDGVDWRFVSDPTLEGASREALRERFRAWVAGDRPDPPARPGYMSSRHSYFVQVDEASLRSVVNDDDPDAWRSGWVNLVRCVEGLDYNLSPEWNAAQDGYRKELEEDGEEYIPEDWIMLAASSLTPGFYGSLNTMSENWSMYYSQPPNLVSH
ncbi:Twin arginine translocation [Cordyceps militaris]|uniref:Twin arginine translocation n=1 Tax=Cordyceps militaris TaxID=73501 RepID=A0A2H4SR25_CORMI|nr:Twin arginine translocation [Cordyceps militaris]